MSQLRGGNWNTRENAIVSITCRLPEKRTHAVECEKAAYDYLCDAMANSVTP